LATVSQRAGDARQHGRGRQVPPQTLSGLVAGLVNQGLAVAVLAASQPIERALGRIQDDRHGLAVHLPHCRNPLLVLSLEGLSRIRGITTQICLSRLGDAEDAASVSPSLHRDEILPYQLLRGPQFVMARSERNASLLRADENHFRVGRIDARICVRRAQGEKQAGRRLR
jgi:hypothetical protein